MRKRLYASDSRLSCGPQHSAPHEQQNGPRFNNSSRSKGLGRFRHRDRTTLGAYALNNTKPFKVIALVATTRSQRVVVPTRNGACCCTIQLEIQPTSCGVVHREVNTVHVHRLQHHRLPCHHWNGSRTHCSTCWLACVKYLLRQSQQRVRINVRRTNSRTTRISLNGFCLC